MKKDTNEIINIANGIDVLINKDTLEPEEYFTILKSSKSSISLDDLKAQALFVSKQIQNAKRAGQTNFLEWLEFSLDVLLKECVLKTKGFDEFIHKKAISELILKIKPEKTVKLIELNRYPRPIPEDIVDKIEEVKSYGIFDEFVVLFTDLTANDYRTKDEREFVERNRDPIIFGLFKEKKTGDTHHRLYHVADWADEDCDLSFDKILEQVNPEDWGRLTDNKLIQYPIPKKQSILSKLFSWMKN
jgi:hypothetical protein